MNVQKHTGFHYAFNPALLGGSLLAQGVGWQVHNLLALCLPEIAAGS